MLWRSIGFKLLFLIVTFSALCVGVFVFKLDQELRREYESDVLAQANEIGQRVNQDIRDGMILHGSANHKESLRKIGYQTIVRKVRILDNKGRIVASTSENETGKTIPMSNIFCKRCHQGKKGTLKGKDIKYRSESITRLKDGSRIANMTFSIPNKPDCTTSTCHTHSRKEPTLGIVDVEVSLKNVDRRLIVRREKNLVFGLILVAGITSLGSLFIYRLIYLPVRQIIKGIKAVSRGDLDSRIAVVSQTDEMGYLARSFNKMTARIKVMTERLSNVNIELERKVEQRTLELQKTQDSVMQSEKLASLGLMAAAIAHEINNPLTAVLTYSSLLYRTAEEGSETREDLEVIVSETTRCRDIVRGLLDFARETNVQQKPINVNDLLRQTIMLVANQVTFQDIEIVNNYAKYLPDTVMDSDQVKQVFLNIMLNAADAMPNGGTLYIHTAFDYERNEITIEFQDTGIGIPEHDIKKIFDPFYTTKAKGKGTGLGLSVSYGIIQRHGGTIDVTSKLGKGTTFIISFPVNPTGRESELTS